jgi:hypothetical protein
MSNGFQVIKILFLTNAYENFDFPMVGENIYRSRTAINQLLTERNRSGGGGCVNRDYKSQG